MAAYTNPQPFWQNSSIFKVQGTEHLAGAVGMPVSRPTLVKAWGVHMAQALTSELENKCLLRTCRVFFSHPR